MGYKDDDACLAKVQPGEPIFVLRAQDMLAPAIVRKWAEEAEQHGCDAQKVAEARQCARAMDMWPSRKFPD